MIVDHGLDLLSEETARRLLAGGEVGRVGICIGALPAIFPVNYRLIDGAIVFWTSPGSKMSAAAEGAVVAFEVDDYQLTDRTGWSVLAIGRAEVVTDPDTAARAKATCLQPFVDGRRDTLVRIEPTFLSGRRLVHGDLSGWGEPGNPSGHADVRHRAAMAPLRRNGPAPRPDRARHNGHVRAKWGDDLLQSVGWSGRLGRQR